MVLQKLRAAGGLGGNEHRAMFVGLHTLPAVIPRHFVFSTCMKLVKRARYVSIRHTSKIKEEERVSLNINRSEHYTQGLHFVL
jgi:hypothetical protein